MLRKNKKGQVLDNLGGLAVGIATLAIMLTVAFLVISQGEEQTIDVGDGFCTGNFTFNVTNSQCCAGDACGSANTSYAYNATGALANATDDIPGWMPLIVIAVVGALLLGLVAMFRRSQ